ncbi:MAG: COX15/CtaA family protein [Flavobacteriia bacterium]|nr:COX15/CtaA family protein [Flavobacteriia bacterium]
MKKRLYLFAKASLILVYLVIVAGALVRMTGSGMGCPDWPKCFGYYIPPTSEETLQWQPDRSFEKGQVIIYEQGLLIALNDFTTAHEIDLSQWESYTKHDYAVFNPYHTWVEFLNRLVGAIAGLATLVLAFFSLRYWKENKWVPLLAIAIVIGMGFQAWLGATVVYSVLAPVKITTHMLMALLIVAALIQLMQLLSPTKNTQKYHPAFHRSIAALVVIILIQTVFGTQVREYVDHQIEAAVLKENWLSAPSIIFYIHRSFSLIPLGLALYAFWLHKKSGLTFTGINRVLGLMLVAVLTGMAMYYIDFPWGSQPLHLVIAALLFGGLFQLFLESRTAKKNLHDGI